jgi:predicted enzyme related to lactoylglutathione lyase
MARPVVHWEIGAKDATKVGDFYRQLFGWSVDNSMPGYGLVAAAPDGIGGGILQQESDMPPYVTIYVAVDDLAASLARAEALGGKTVVPPTPIPNVGAFAMFEDPEGHMIGIIKQQP